VEGLTPGGCGAGVRVVGGLDPGSPESTGGRTGDIIGLVSSGDSIAPGMTSTVWHLAHFTLVPGASLSALNLAPHPGHCAILTDPPPTSFRTNRCLSEDRRNIYEKQYLDANPYPHAADSTNINEIEQLLMKKN
jgi:hypothetical protein